jgi:HD-like signal output (HDOD) protein
VPDEFDEIVQVVYNDNVTFCATEKATLGFDHAEVGAMLVNKWNLSPVLEDTILNHHNPEAMTVDNQLLLYLDLANKVCHKLGIGFVDDPDLDLENCLANRILGLPPEAFDVAIARLQETLESEMEIFI